MKIRIDHFVTLKWEPKVGDWFRERGSEIAVWIGPFIKIDDCTALDVGTADLRNWDYSCGEYRPWYGTVTVTE